MADSFEFLADKLLTYQQNSINLTGEDYDATPIFVTLNTEINFQKRIVVEYSELQSGYYYWGYQNLKWGEPGLKWQASANTWSGKVLVDDFVSANYNNNAFTHIMNMIDDSFDYLAYGTGSVSDDATSLVTEIGRIVYENKAINIPILTMDYFIDENTSNGEIIREYGLAKLSTGDISSTTTYSPIEKSKMIYVQIISNIILKNKM